MPEAGGEALLAVQALLLDGVVLRQVPAVVAASVGVGHRNHPRACGCAPPRVASVRADQGRNAAEAGELDARRRRRSRAGRWRPRRSTSAAPSSAPATNAALASTSARHASPATTVTDARPESAGSPVRGSMRWCSARSPRVHARRSRVLVAIAPSREREQPGAPGGERVVDLDHPAVRRRRVAARPEVAAQVHQHAAHARQRRPRAARADTSSAAAPLPMPPRSSATPGGSRTADTRCRARRRRSPARRARRRVGVGRRRRGRPRRSRGRSPRPRARRAPSGRSDRRCRATRRPRARSSANVLGRHDDRRARGVVEPAQLARRPEPRPPRLAHLERVGRQRAERRSSRRRRRRPRAPRRRCPSPGSAPAARGTASVTAPYERVTDRA